AGETLSLRLADAPASASLTATLYASRGATELEAHDTRFPSAVSGQVVFDAAPATRDYYLSLESTFSPLAATLRLAVGQPGCEPIVSCLSADAECGRLEGGCGEVLECG